MNREHLLLYRLLLLADVVTLGAAFVFTYWGTPVLVRNFFGNVRFDLGPLNEYLWLHSNRIPPTVSSVL